MLIGILKWHRPLIRVGDVQSARCECCSSLIDAASPLQFFRALNTLFSTQSKMLLRIRRQLGNATKLTKIVGPFAAAGAS
jgi:hypothetical protein